MLNTTHVSVILDIICLVNILVDVFSSYEDIHIILSLVEIK